MFYHKTIAEYTKQIVNSFEKNYSQKTTDLFHNLFVGFYEWNWDFKPECPSDILAFANHCIAEAKSSTTLGNIYTSYLFASRLAHSARFDVDKDKINPPTARDVQMAKDASEELSLAIGSGLLPGSGSFDIPSRPEPEEVVQLCKGVIRSVSDSRMQKALKNISAIAHAIEFGLVEIEDNQKPVFGYEYGRELDSICTEEFVDLASLETRSRFLLKYAKGELLLDKESPSKKGLGDLIILKDRSGSTNQICVEDAVSVCDMETAIFAALASFQMRKKFKTQLVEFDSNILYQSPIVEKKKHVSTEIIKAVGRVPAGGTSFQTALQRAEKLIISQPKSKKATKGIILLSDGYDYMTDQYIEKFNNFKKAHQVKLYSYIFCEKLDREATIYQISDKIYNVKTTISIMEQLDALYEAVVL
jgi:uncharacterized protein YegL